MGSGLRLLAHCRGVRTGRDGICTPSHLRDILLTVMGIVWIAGVLLGATLVGFAVFRIFRRARRVKTRIFLSVVVGGITLAISGIVLFFVNATPAVDEPLKQERIVRIDIYSGQQSGNVPSAEPRFAREQRPSFGSTDFEDASATARIEFKYSPTVTVHEDFSVTLFVLSRASSLPVSNYIVQLSAPESAKVRTSDHCAGESRGQPVSHACSASKRSTFSVDWMFPPKKKVEAF